MSRKKNIPLCTEPVPCITVSGPFPLASALNPFSWVNLPLVESQSNEGRHFLSQMPWAMPSTWLRLSKQEKAGKVILWRWAQVSHLVGLRVVPDWLLGGFQVRGRAVGRLRSAWPQQRLPDKDTESPCFVPAQHWNSRGTGSACIMKGDYRLQMQTPGMRPGLAS